jgi:lipocalin
LATQSCFSRAATAVADGGVAAAIVIRGETEARGLARIVDAKTSAKLKVRFAPAWLSWLGGLGRLLDHRPGTRHSWAVVVDSRSRASSR